MKSKILLIVSICICMIAALTLVACNNTTVPSTSGQLVDMYGVVKKPIADPDPTNKEDKKSDISHYTVDGDFRDNEVGIMLTNSESLNNLKYTYSLQDFPECDAIEIEELTGGTYLERFRKEYDNGVAYTNKGMVHPSKFNRQFSLTLNIHSKENVLRVANELMKRKDVACASPNSIMHYFDSQIDLTNSAQQWGNGKIDLAGAWQYNTGSADVKVGVMDSGVAKHPSLVDNLSDTRKVYGYQGYDMGLSDNYEISESLYIDGNNLHYQGHGTQVAGVIGSKLENTTSAQGVCQNVTMISLNVMGADGEEDISAAIQAVGEAAGLGIKIINYSAGNYYDDYRFEDTIRDFSGLFVCGAGNIGSSGVDNRDIDIKPVYPASYDLSNIISVGASNSDDKICEFSCYGATSVDLFAPGEGIKTTAMTEANPDATTPIYGAYNGTSFAAPYVAGVAALLWSYCPSLTVAQVKASILNNVDVIHAMNGMCVSGGRLNAKKALQNVVHSHTDYAMLGNYTNLGLHEGHKSDCKYCTDYCFTESHTWSPFGKGYKCHKCKLYTLRYPIEFGPNALKLLQELALSGKTLSNGDTHTTSSGALIIYDNGRYYLLIECDESGNPLGAVPTNLFNEKANAHRCIDVV